MPRRDRGQEAGQLLALEGVGRGVEALPGQDGAALRVQHGDVHPPPPRGAVLLPPLLVEEGDEAPVREGLQVRVHGQGHAGAADGPIPRDDLAGHGQVGPVQADPVEAVHQSRAGQIPGQILPAVGQGAASQGLAVDPGRHLLGGAAGIGEGMGLEPQPVGPVRLDPPQGQEEAALGRRGPDGRAVVERVRLCLVPALAPVGEGAGLAQAQLETVLAWGLHRAVGPDALAGPEGLFLQGQDLIGQPPGVLPGVCVGEALGDGWEEEHVADVVEVDQLLGLGLGRLDQGRVHLAAGLDLHQGLEEGDAPEIVHLEVRGPADVAPDHGLAVDRLVVLEPGALRAEGAEAVAPSQGQLHHADRRRVLGDLLVDGRHPGVGEGQGHGQVLEEDGEGQEGRQSDG